MTGSQFAENHQQNHGSGVGEKPAWEPGTRYRSMSFGLGESLARVTKWVSCFVLLLCAIFFAITTIHWPLTGDAAIMHYVVFLIDHGRKPYRDFADINMPGAWLTHFVVIHVAGSGSLTWRLFDYLLMVLATVGMVSIAQLASRFAGLFAGCIFTLIHGQDGIYEPGQRDFIISVLVVLALAALFSAVRRNVPWRMLLFGLFAGFAAIIKPTFLPLGILLLVPAFVALRKQNRSAGTFILLGLLGWLIPLVFTVLLLWRMHALRAFVAIMRGPVLYHAGLAHRPLGYLLLHSVSPLLPLVIVWLCLLPAQAKHWITWEGAALGVGLAVGLFSYVVQAKGYSYQRYPEIAVLLLIMAIDFALAMERRGAVRLLGFAGIAYGAFFLAPVSAYKASHYDWRNTEYISGMEQSLVRLGGPRLSGKVQCIDTIDDCYNALNHLHLISATGLLYDEFVFGPGDDPVIAQTRKDFQAAIQARPPEVIVVTDPLFPSGPDHFAKLGLWPVFDEDLRQNYRLCADMKPTTPVRWWSRTEEPHAFRIYCLNQRH